MKFATFNANSIRARLPQITDWLERNRPDILCIQETKVQDKDFPREPLESKGYRVVFRGQKSYNGVAILSRAALEDVRRDLYEGGDAEARFVSARVGSWHVVNVYVPQGFAVESEKFQMKLRWMEDLSHYLRHHYRPAEPLLVAGDFNVAVEDRDVYDPESLRGGVCFHPDEQARLREVLAWGLEDVFRRDHKEGGYYTFWDYRVPNALKRKMGWRIDYILATKPVSGAFRDSWIDMEARAAPKPSDHTFLVAEFDAAW